ncbi:MAG: response regulator [Nannocystis sp.]|nr:response regulator [Nannocystis sp.]MBA3549535.1 response regulator [Nannocystis sp.]
MTTTGKILIIDDDPMFVRVYQTLLGEDGYVVETAMDREAALARLADGSAFSVVILDQKLQGPKGPDAGLDLLHEIHNLAPQAKTLIATAFATDTAIKRAFEAGAFDYLEKNQLFETMLRAKVRNAVELFHERELQRLPAAQREQALQSCWRAVLAEADPHRKGALLEELMVLLFGSIPGFRDIWKNRRNPLEEIDLVLRNESTDPLWHKEGYYILVECKHWTRPVGARELREFANKLRRRHGRARLGFFTSMSDFTAGFQEEARRLGESDHLIVTIPRASLEQLVHASDRNRLLRDLHERAVTDISADK